MMSTYLYEVIGTSRDFSSSSSISDSESDIMKKKSNILRWKEEIDKIFFKLHGATSKIESSYHSLKGTKSNGNDSGRLLTIEYRCQRKNKSLSSIGNSIKGRDFSHSLDIKPISNCKFNAHFDLNVLPSGDDVTLRVCGEKIYIYLNDSETGQRGSKIGNLSLPMYIDNMTLDFEILDNNQLQIQAKLKGILSRQLSTSSDSIWKRKKPNYPVLKKQFAANSEWNISGCVNIEN